MNSFGKHLRLTTFGESHGPAVGGILDGMPSGFRIDREAVQKALDARRPGRSAAMSARNESDKVEFLSGMLEDGTTLGTPIGFIIRNNDCRSADYEALRHVFRPGHADYTYQIKYGVRDHRGGGRASARETASRVVGGAIAAQWLREKFGVTFRTGLTQVGRIKLGTHEDLIKEIERVRMTGDSVGGIVSGEILGLPPGVGEPVGDKFQARLAEAMMSINAAKGFEYGDGFEAAEMTGSESNDGMTVDGGGKVRFLSNHCGGILGGITNGMPVTYRVAFKATPSIALPQMTVSDSGEQREITVTGRHDACVALRAVAVVEAMAALTTADLLMAKR